MNEFIVTINDKKKFVNLISENKIEINGIEVPCELLHLSGNTYILKLENKFYQISADKVQNGNYTISFEGQRFDAIVRSALQEKASQLLQQSGASKKRIDVRSPMPGMILKIKKNKGEEISRGETIIILEAMKMENDLRAPQSGIIKDILIKEGTAVEKGTVLFSIE